MGSTVQDDLLARVIFDEFVCEKQLADFWHLSYHIFLLILSYGFVGVTVQEYLLARVIFGEFVCKKQLADFILAEFLQF